MGAERLHHVGEKVKSDLAPMESYRLHGQLAPIGRLSSCFKKKTCTNAQVRGKLEFIQSLHQGRES
jgi:hypothetical protein